MSCRNLDDASISQEDAQVQSQARRACQIREGARTEYGVRVRFDVVIFDNGSKWQTLALN